MSFKKSAHSRDHIDMWNNHYRIDFFLKNGDNKSGITTIDRYFLEKRRQQRHQTSLNIIISETTKAPNLFKHHHITETTKAPNLFEHHHMIRPAQEAATSPEAFENRRKQHSKLKEPSLAPNRDRAARKNRGTAPDEIFGLQSEQNGGGPSRGALKRGSTERDHPDAIDDTL
ncbi:hypothetical protein Bca101_046821 [Brassica carinata]